MRIPDEERLKAMPVEQRVRLANMLAVYVLFPNRMENRQEREEMNKQLREFGIDPEFFEQAIAEMEAQDGKWPSTS